MRVRSSARVVCFAALLFLAGCAAHLVPDYDEQIDSGLTSANTDITGFVDKMISAAGTQAGTFEQNKDFYISENAKLSTIRVRAEAHRALNSCPSADVISHAVLSNVPATATTGPIPTMSAKDVIAKLPQDDCEVVLITLIQDAFTNLQTFHSSQGEKGIPSWTRGPILAGGVGSLIHSAIQVQVALKSVNSSGGK